jgi:hypothetical protein
MCFTFQKRNLLLFAKSPKSSTEALKRFGFLSGRPLTEMAFEVFAADGLNWRVSRRWTRPIPIRRFA